jgi:GTP-binding protein Era
MKSGFIALLGLPNAGKSTLVNALIGEKVGIVSKKPQTTRSRVVGILNTEEAQICYVDSPGAVTAEQGAESDSLHQPCDRQAGGRHRGLEGRHGVVRQ